MDEGQWTCAACTFRHAGVVAELRECTICGTSRLVVNAAQQPESRRSVDPAVSPKPRRSPSSQLLALPDDVLQRVLVGVPRDDHDVAALVCKRTRGIITGPRFLALRQRYGFAEYGIVTIADREPFGASVLHIKMAHKREVMATIPAGQLSLYGSTTDGGARLFVTTTPSQILAVDASSRRWRRFATLPRNQRFQCMEVHGGLLYVAGGSRRGEPAINSFHVFNEVTGLWEDLPPMPHACRMAASGVIGNELFIAGGYDPQQPGRLRTLQIYDIATRTWRVGAPPPRTPGITIGVVADGKLFLIRSQQSTLVYDPHSNTWTEEAGPESDDTSVLHACAHEGRVFAFRRDGTAYSRATDGSWSLCTRAVDRENPPSTCVSGSVLLG